MTTTPHKGDLADAVEAMDLHPRTKRNFRMQYRLGTVTLVPWLRSLGVFPNKAEVCEIGCAEGGVLTAFMKQGASFGLGTDIAGALLDQISEPLAEALNVEVTYAHHDVIGDAIPRVWKERFDVVVLRDVIEHLDDPTIAIQNIARIMKPGGVILITFPPYHSAFGGHQQLLGNGTSGLPWVHLLPKSLFFCVIKSGDPQNQEEVRRLHRIRCTPKKIHQSLAGAGLSIVDERYFGLRPVFRWKYQKAIPDFELTAVKRLPFVKNLSMEAAFVARKPK